MKTNFLLFASLMMLAIGFSSCSDNENTYSVTAQNGLNIRATPSPNGIILGKLEHYDDVEVDTIINNWAKIKYKDQEAYVSAQYIEKEEDLSFGTVLFFFFLLLAFGGGGTAAVRGLKKDGTLDRRFKANRNR